MESKKIEKIEKRIERPPYREDFVFIGKSTFEFDEFNEINNIILQQVNENSKERKRLSRITLKIGSQSQILILPVILKNENDPLYNYFLEGLKKIKNERDKI